MWSRLLFVGWCWSCFSIRFGVFTFHTRGLYQCTYIVNIMTMIHTSHLDVCMYFCIYVCIMYVNIIGCDIIMIITSTISRDFLVRFFFSQMAYLESLRNSGQGAHQYYAWSVKSACQWWKRLINMLYLLTICGYDSKDIILLVFTRIF